MSGKEVCKACRVVVEEIGREKRRVEAQGKKEIAVLTQKVELMSLELKEAEEREQTARKMHNTMMAALDSKSPDKDLFQKELEFATKLHDGEKDELRKHYEGQKKIYDEQILEMRETIQTQESRLKELEVAKASLEAQQEAAEATFRKEKGELLEELNVLSEEREEIEMLARENQAEFEQSKLEEFEEERREILAKHQEELDRLHLEFGDSMKKMRQQNERELAKLQDGRSAKREETSKLDILIA